MIHFHSSQLSRQVLGRATRLPHRTLVQIDDRVRIVARSEPDETKPVPTATPSELDAQVLNEIQSRDVRSTPPLNALFNQYSANARSVLHATLAYEPTPPSSRRVCFGSGESEVLLLTHAVDLGAEHKVNFCSGFAIKTDARSTNLIVSCAHTLEKMRHSRLMNSESTGRSGTLIFGRRDQSSGITVGSALDVLTSLPRSDLVVFSTDKSLSRTLPVSPYPARAGARIRAHFVSEKRPADLAGWSPWIHGTWSKWVRGEVLGYRDFAGREAEPGTYDSLNHLLFSPPPTAGSSGGPIVDEETGSVIGVILGSRMDNRIEGVRGWGVPSEIIYEMFRLPGLSHLG